MTPEARNLADEFGGIWGEHPVYKLSFWQDEVADDNTRSSYWDWVLNQVRDV